jgi:hypothetical protein
MQLIFIRHGEKTKSDSKNLSTIGYLRAKFLVDYFIHNYSIFNLPNHVYAMDIKGKHKSRRCIETVWPLIKEAKLDFTWVHRSQTYKFATSLRNDRNMDKTFLICWEHSRIVDMLNILGMEQICSWGLSPESQYTDNECFDATWVVNLTETSIRLRVYRQFDIVNEEPRYVYPRTKVWYDEEIKIKALSWFWKYFNIYL